MDPWFPCSGTNAATGSGSREVPTDPTRSRMEPELPQAQPKELRTAQGYGSVPPGGGILWDPSARQAQPHGCHLLTSPFSPKGWLLNTRNSISRAHRLRIFPGFPGKRLPCRWHRDAELTSATTRCLLCSEVGCPGWQRLTGGCSSLQPHSHPIPLEFQTSWLGKHLPSILPPQQAAAQEGPVRGFRHGVWGRTLPWHGSRAAGRMLQHSQREFQPQPSLHTAPTAREPPGDGSAQDRAHTKVMAGGGRSSPACPRVPAWLHGAEGRARVPPAAARASGTPRAGAAAPAGSLWGLRPCPVPNRIPEPGTGGAQRCPPCSEPAPGP